MRTNAVRFLYVIIVLSLLCAFTQVHAESELQQSALLEEALSTTRTAIVRNPTKEDRLNMRSGAGTKYDSIGRYYTGVVVEVVEELGDWTKVAIGKDPARVTGYMATEFLVFDAEYDAVESAIPSGETRNPIATKPPTLQRSPRTSGTVLAEFGAGIPIVALGISGDYYHVYIAGSYGYMNKNYIEITGIATYPLEDDATLPESFEFGIITTTEPATMLTAPYVESAVLGNVPTGATVRIDKTDNDWAKVTLNYTTGYILLSDVRQDKNAFTLVAVDKITASEKDVKLYEFPSVASIVLGEYSVAKEPVEMTALSRAGTFYRVTMQDGKTGYIEGAGAVALAYGSQEAPEAGYGIVSVPVPTTTLNMRVAADTTSVVMRKLWNGDQLEIIGSKGDYYRVRYDRKVGYVQKKFITVINDVGR